MLVAAVLGWALVGDSLVLLIGAAPLVIVCGARSFALLALRRQPLAVAWYDLALTAAGVAAAIGGTALSVLIKANGGFALSPQATQSTVPSAALPANLSATVSDFLGLFSADFFNARLNAWLAVAAVHPAFACLVAVALFLALRASRRDFLAGDLIAQLLAVAIVINLLAYVLLYPGSSGDRAGDRPGLRARRRAGRPGARRAAAPAAPGAAARPRRGRRGHGAGAAAADRQADPARRVRPGPVPGRPSPDRRAGRLLERRQHDARQPGRVVVAAVRYHRGQGLVGASRGRSSPGCSTAAPTTRTSSSRPGRAGSRR